MRIRPLFAWYDLWVGVYWDRKARKLYILPLPCVGVVIEFGTQKHNPDPIEDLDWRIEEGLLRFNFDDDGEDPFVSIQALSGDRFYPADGVFVRDPKVLEEASQALLELSGWLDETLKLHERRAKEV